MMELRDELVTMLADRGVINGAEVIDGLENLEGALATIAYFDDKAGAKTGGLLVYLLRTGEASDYRRPETSSDRGAALEDEMRAMGFEERLVPFAASAVSVRGPASKERIEGHLRVSQPWLFEIEREAT